MIVAGEVVETEQLLQECKVKDTLLVSQAPGISLASSG